MTALAEKIGTDSLGRRLHATRRRDKDVALHTEESESHTHCAIFDGDGDGYTSAAEDGHRHRIAALVLEENSGHTHGLSTRRCPREHDERGRHVDGKR